MPTYHSKRAEILRKVLDYINHGDWDEFDGFMIFGKEAFDIWTGAVEAGKDYDDTPFRDADSKSKISRGKRAIAKRVRLGTLPDDQTIPEHVEMLKRINPRIDLAALNKLLRGHKAIASSPVAEM